MKRHVRSPDGRSWTVQLVWWPRPSQTALTTDAALGGSSFYSGGGVLFGVVFDAIALALFPLTFLGRVVLRRPWLIEAFRDDERAEGGAWRVRGLGSARDAADVIAAAIALGDRTPAPVGATPVRYRPNLARRRLNV